MQIYNDITEFIGHLPLVKLQRLPQQVGCVAEIVFKLEGMNPAKSVKHRIAVSMMLEAERAGLSNKPVGYAQSYLDQTLSLGAIALWRRYR